MNNKKNNAFAIITAYRYQDNEGNYLPKNDNNQRNRILRGILSSAKMRVYQLVGHWQEVPADIESDEAKTLGLLNDSVERSYLVQKPSDMSVDEFIPFVKDCMTIDGMTQDACIIHTDKYYLLHNDGSLESLGEEMSLNKISQVFSESVLKAGTPFIFDGISRPNGNMDKLAFEKSGISYFRSLSVKEHNECLNAMRINLHNEDPKVGIFWYSPIREELFGVYKVSLKSSEVQKTSYGVTSKMLHEQYCQSFSFIGSYQEKPRGRVYYRNNQFLIHVGNWIDECFEAIDLVAKEFDFDKEDYDIVKDFSFNV
ncbi:MAG: hypothetical protein K6G92_07570 [Bacteroidaceae bacterium]|nr:hypothetical protein [Bacteroidaceae bacterium]